MKKITIIFLSVTLVLFSCTKTPHSMFTVDDDKPEVGQEVFFSNDSRNGDRFEWDFGDGYVSSDANPSHIFTATGTFKVTLTAYSGGTSDVSSLTITVLVPTLLVVEVREWTESGNGPSVPNASVLLYPTLTDWDNQTNSVMEAFTNKDGVAVFSNLDPYVYYVDVWEQTHDNYQLASEDVGFIRTPEVLKNTITGFIAYVDIVNHTSGIAKDRNMVMKKAGRRAVDKNLMPELKGSWQDLLKMKVSK
jgi:PKD repeat protein